MTTPGAPPSTPDPRGPADGSPPPRAAVIGLGAMGRALATALLARGVVTTVWNRSPGRATALRERGALVAPDLATAVSGHDLLVVCLTDHAAVLEALAPVADRLAGRTVVDLTNRTPAQAREATAWLAARGGALLPGGIMAVPPMIGTDAAFVLYAGPREEFDRHVTVLGAFGEARYVGDDPGAAALVDLALLAGMYGLYGGALHAHALVRAAGADADGFATLLHRWLGTLLDAATAAPPDGPDGDAASPLAMQAAAYDNQLVLARDLAVSTELVEPMGRLLDRAVRAGLGDRDVDVLVDLLSVPGASATR